MCSAMLGVRGFQLVPGSCCGNDTIEYEGVISPAAAALKISWELAEIASCLCATDCQLFAPVFSMGRKVK